MIQPPYPRNVPLRKGALVAVESSGQQTVVRFQYNPESLQRNLTPSTVGGDEGNRSRAVRFTGAPAQSLSFEAHLDAIDALDRGEETAIRLGVYPQIRALELLAYPSSGQVTQYQSTLASGGIAILPLLAPRTILVWGSQRVVPVRLTRVSVVEEQFDGNLNPIRATLTLEAHVLTYSDLLADNPDYDLFLSHQKNMERVAREGSTSSLTGTGLSRLGE